MSVAATAGGQAALEDITGGTAGDWLVIGWFTLDYRPLAEEFAANLAKHGAPFHLWARPKLAKGWNTQQKPSVVLQAMDAYPSKTLIAGAVFGLIALGIIGLALIGVIAASDDNDVDLRDHSDWERLR